MNTLEFEQLVEDAEYIDYDDGDRLVGEVVDERAFAIITSTKDAYMRFKFVALHGRSNVKFFIFFYFHIIKLHFLSFIISFE